MIGRKVSVGAAASFAGILLSAQQCRSFRASHATPRKGRRATALPSSAAADEPSTQESANPEAIRLKDDLVALAAATRRGFSASRSDRDRAKGIIGDLAKYTPSDQPAAAYYAETGADHSAQRATLAGKWTLIYTDAPDITSLEGGPLSPAKLGRIGQECDPPSIKNVIEWSRPDWASSLPFGGGGSGRVLQRVCCEGSAARDSPGTVDLRIAGLELSGGSGGDAAGGGGWSSFLDGPAALLERNPVKLQGPLTAPFGKFDILYLDADMRITRTYQGYFAVNIREENEWF